MTPGKIVDTVKRTAGFGVLGNNADQAAIDLLAHLNIRARQVWRFHDWDYSLDDILLTVTSSSYDLTLASTTGEVYELGIQGEEGYLKRYSRRQYLQWEKLRTVSEAGSLVGYIPLGRDASKNIKLRFFRAPANSTIVEGWGKKRLVELTTADWTTEMAYFPPEAQDVVYQFLLSDGYRLMKDLRAEGQERIAMAALRELRGEVAGEADIEPQSPPPDYVTFVNRQRGRGTRVV